METLDVIPAQGMDTLELDMQELLSMQELDELEAPGWTDIVSYVSGAVVGGGATYYISVATVAAT